MQQGKLVFITVSNLNEFTDFGDWGQEVRGSVAVSPSAIVSHSLQLAKVREVDSPKSPLEAIDVPS
jgi:hypothetical protein